LYIERIVVTIKLAVNHIVIQNNSGNGFLLVTNRIKKKKKGEPCMMTGVIYDDAWQISRVLDLVSYPMTIPPVELP